jgi:hypothetical protein
MSEIRAATVSNLAGTGPVTLTKQAAPKVYYDVDQSSNVIIGSFNVSSFTDVSTGVYTVTFTNAFASTTDLSQVISNNTDEEAVASRNVGDITAQSRLSNGTFVDTNLNTGILIGGLA